jgi:serine/threonine protein kinase
MSDNGVVVGQLVYDFLRRRFQGELVSTAQVLREHPELPRKLWKEELEPRLREAWRSHRYYLGQTIADYDLGDPIGVGGFGEVYRACHRKHGFSRALKVVSKKQFIELSGIREYMNRIGDHPHLVPVHHVGEAGEQYFYYTMPIADNLTTGEPKTLASWLALLARGAGKSPGAAGRLPIKQALVIGCAVATGLEHLHKEDLVHRDVKPGNILSIGRIWQLGDVGLLKSLRGKVDDAGTRIYWPPEGPAHDPKKADLYALGLTIFQAITGCDAETAAELVRRNDLSAVPKDAAALVPVLKQACAPDPKDRMDSARSMRLDLDRLRERVSKASTSRLRGLLSRGARLLSVLWPFKRKRQP